jgi:phosphosulfolactate synthase (CoM biosynthesis protein A)
MGNRAVITFTQDFNSPCIYLHWNGGRASVEGFLQAARELGLRRLETSSGTLAGKHAEALVLNDLAEMIARHFFGGEVGLTVYRVTYGQADKDNWDNGVYLLNRDMTIGGRLFKRGAEENDSQKTAAIVEQIVARAPAFNN